MMVKIWESPKWKELMKNIRESTIKSIATVNTVVYPSVDPTLLLRIANFLKNQLPQLTEQKDEDIYILLENFI